MNMKKVLSLIAVFVLIFSLVSCGKTRREDNGKPNIIATLFPQYDFARAIAGDKANVKMLLSPGTDSHDYDPTPSAALEISQCDLFVYTGDNMEMWAATLLTNVDRQKVYVLDCTQGIEFKASDDDHEHGHEHELDPHVWTSPVNAIKMVENILDAICAVDGENAAFYKANAEKYIKQLDALDAEFREVVATGIRKEVVFGSRFALKYFADEYGLSYTAAIASCESEDEPSVSVMNAIIEKVKTEHIPVVYYEELSEPRIAQKIAEETGCKIRQFHSCHNVSKDEFDRGVTYIDLMKENAKVLKEGLD